MLLGSALTTALEMARNIFRAGRTEKESWGRRDSVRTGSRSLRHHSTFVLPSQVNLCYILSHPKEDV